MLNCDLAFRHEPALLIKQAFLINRMKVWKGHMITLLFPVRKLDCGSSSFACFYLIIEVQFQQSHERRPSADLGTYMSTWTKHLIIKADLTKGRLRLRMDIRGRPASRFLRPMRRCLLKASRFGLGSTSGRSTRRLLKSWLRFLVAYSSQCSLKANGMKSLMSADAFSVCCRMRSNGNFNRWKLSVENEPGGSTSLNNYSIK